jgi:hypothetical protein
VSLNSEPVVKKLFPQVWGDQLAQRGFPSEIENMFLSTNVLGSRVFTIVLASVCSAQEIVDDDS